MRQLLLMILRPFDLSHVERAEHASTVNFVMLSFSGLLLFLLIFPTLIILYLLLLTVAAFFAPAPPGFPGRAARRFLILIPAHNEEKSLPVCLNSLDHIDYPSDYFQVHVVADNCQDDTAAVAKKFGAFVHERTDANHLGKGPALQWLLERLQQSGQPYDALVFVDADTLVSRNLLRAADARLAAGAQALQAYYAVQDVERSWAISLRYAALAVLHYLRPQGRMALGASAGLKGNGMVFPAGTIHALNWSSSLTEDIQLHMDLLFSGRWVEFMPEATVWGEMPESLARSQTQHARWEAGRVALARRYILRLLREAYQSFRSGDRRTAFRFFDAAMEHAIPPLSILVSASLALLIAALVLVVFSRSDGNILNTALLALAAANLFGQMIYVLIGLRLAGAPRSVYRNLLFAPWLMVWKVGQYLRIFVGERQKAWVRTARNEG
jgi:1,2-diacylglycerol 3-beta-glucosyltransferase